MLFLWNYTYIFLFIILIIIENLDFIEANKFFILNFEKKEK
jgi:hypothetical protein